MSGTDFQGLAKDDVKVSQASINTITPMFSTVDIELAPTAGATQVNLEFIARCEQIRVPVRLKLDVRKKHKKNADVPVELVK